MSEIVGRLENQIKKHYTRAVVQAVDETGNGAIWVRAVGGASTVMAVITGDAAATTVVELPGNNSGGVLYPVSGTVNVCNEPVITEVYAVPASTSFQIAAGVFRVVLSGEGAFQIAYPRDAFYTKLTVLDMPDDNTSFRFAYPGTDPINFIFLANPGSDTATNKYIDTNGLTTEAEIATAISDKINSVFTTNKEMWSNAGAGGVDESVIILSFDNRWTECLELNNIYNTVTDLNTTIPAFRSKKMADPVVSESKDLILASYVI